MPITSGSIEYERRLNLGEYNHKNVVAKVSWTVYEDEDDDVLAAYAIDKAVMRVKDVLNWKPAIAPGISFVVEPPAEVVVPDPNLVPGILADVPVSEPKLVPIIENIENKAAPNLAAQHPAAEIAAGTVGIPPALKRHRRTKAEMEAARAAEAGPTQTTSSEPSLGPSEETSPTSSATTAEPGMPSFDPDPEPPAEVTDQDLLDACQAKASSGKPVVDIKELVAKFSPGGLVQTPKDARRRFLDELAKL